ncbi:response regulator transcription factor [Olivibacter sitiensis]|uniref:response regulator transcription factor n=1 Tax=Olivibacter sitiensis TaxID=376470 RepID=UPI000489C188|nr:response regulator transcription factor [Olivibacter sitiensis]
MKVLLVEDDPNLASVIKRGLSDSGYQVECGVNGPVGLDMALENMYDLIILDIMLPQMSGIEVCKALRKEQIDTPILMLTALGTTEHVVDGLDSGADDYMRKPFTFEELNARLRTLSRRNSQAQLNSNVLQVGDLKLDLDRRIASRASTEITLTATEFRLLEFLMKNKNKVVTRMEILENVWDISFNMGTNVVDVYVNYLRKKVDKQFDKKFIHTMIGIGYVLKDQ